MEGHNSVMMQDTTVCVKTERAQKTCRLKKMKTYLVKHDEMTVQYLEVKRKMEIQIGWREGGKEGGKEDHLNP